MEKGLLHFSQAGEDLEFRKLTVTAYLEASVADIHFLYTEDHSHRPRAPIK